jgi:hypothetical protein
MIFMGRGGGGMLTLFLTETEHILFYTYCLLQLAMCRSVLLGGWSCSDWSETLVLLFRL